MSVRTSAQKRDEKRTTLDEIKKIGYCMELLKTAMDAVKYVETPGSSRTHTSQMSSPEMPLTALAQQLALCSNLNPDDVCLSLIHI